jgi:DNA-binding transcriptional MerR regulator
MNFDLMRQWRGTAEALTNELKRQIMQFGLSVEPPALRTVRSWRTKQLLSQPKGQVFGFRQILEGLAITLLLKKGWTLAAIAQVLPSFPDSELEKQIISEADNQDPSWSPMTQVNSVSLLAGHRQMVDLAKDAVILLAQGILRQYDRVLNGEVVRQNDSMPPELYRAMCKLGRLYIEEGKSDRAACVHTVLDMARYSLDDYQKWELEVFRQADFTYGSVNLIDWDLRVPTSDCAQLAIKSGYGEDNVIQDRLYQQLKEATERLGSRSQDKAYTAVRQLIGRRSLIDKNELYDYLVEHNLTPIQSTIFDFFDPVPDLWLINGKAHRCAHCGTLMRPDPNRNRFPDGRCPLRECNSRYEAKVSEKLDIADELLIAKPQILTYWTSPAIDELAIFDLAKEKGLNVELYPESDSCDVAINGRKIGIDAKSYNSPVTLALRLNRSIGGLVYYHRRIIAVSDRVIETQPNYISILQSTLDRQGDPATLEILTVSQVIELLRGM